MSGVDIERCVFPRHMWFLQDGELVYGKKCMPSDGCIDISIL